MKVPRARICHRTQDRLRFKISAKKGDRNYFSKLNEAFKRHLKIEGVQTNVLTGSLLVWGHHLDEADIGEFAEKHKLFKLAALDGCCKPLSRRITDPVRELDTLLKRVSGGEVDLGGLLFVFLCGFGISEILWGRLTRIPWYTAFWYALAILSMSTDDETPSTGSQTGPRTGPDSPA